MNEPAKRTVMEILDATAAAHGDRPAMRVKRGGEWQTTTWNDYREAIRLVARGFIKIGLQPGQGVSIIGFNGPEWFLADIGAIVAGGVPAGIYTTNSAEQCQYIADHSDSAVAVVEDADQLAKFEAVRGDLPKLRGIIVMRGGEDRESEGIYSWRGLLDLGKQVSEADLQARIDGQNPDDTCTLIYTSGTTGNPKAVMISHDNATWTAGRTVSVFQDFYETSHGTRDFDFSVISYLPLSHIAEQIVSLHGPMVIGGCTSFAESIEALGDNLREVRPTIFFAVPRVWEKIQARIVTAAARNSGLEKKIGAWARKQGLAGGYAEQSGGARPVFYGLADKLVFSKVRARLGLDRCVGQITSAAPISKDTLEFFLSLGVPIYEVYGMSECTGPATVSLPHKYRTGKVGTCLPGAELKIADDGEICMRGRHVFKGYYKDPETTAETVDEDGWLHSGDIGTIDDEQFVQITDRKKDILITAGGENIAPQLIEGMLKSIPVVSQAVVIGDRRKFLSALVTLDPERVTAAVAEAQSPASDAESAATCEIFHRWLTGRVEQINGQLARVQSIKKIAIIPAEFSIEGGELTPTMKIKRKVVNAKYVAQIEAFYAR